MPVRRQLIQPARINGGSAATARRRSSSGLGLAVFLLAAVGAAASAPKPAPLAQARQWVEWGDWSQARELLAGALRAAPNDPQLLAYDAHVLIAFGQDKQAVSLTRKALKVDPQCGTCHLFLAEALGKEAKGYSRFRALFELRHIRKHLQRALALSPGNPDVYWGFINYYLQVPPSVGGGVPKAFAYVGRLAHYDAVDGAIALGEVEIAAGHPQQALAAYRKVAAEHARDPRALFVLGEALFRQGEFAAAEPWLKRARRMAPKSAFYTGYEAAALVHLNQQTRAWQMLRAFDARPGLSRLPDFMVAQALKLVGQNFPWARQLLESYLAAPREPNQPTHQAARTLLASLG